MSIDKSRGTAIAELVCQNTNQEGFHMHDHSLPFDNLLLCALGAPEWQRCQPYLERVELARNQSLYEPGETPSHAYFPTSALISMMHLTETGACAESAVVGNDGMLGVCLLMGGGSTSSCAVVQMAGDAYRMPARALRAEFNRSGPVMDIMLRYMQSLLTQASQRAVCMRHHSVSQQVAFCLLQHLDRVSGDDLVMTQEAIAQRLGVRREGVTHCAHHFQKLGLIRYARGHISVLDRDALEEHACECYSVLRDEQLRLLPETHRHDAVLMAA